ncbi:DNA cytosine methyltransferase [Rhodobacteraceae bacterium F11138]|nr:DNA cytosine methyltransferase [Rhodobacteraceae bacterium F11138]
MLEPIRFLSVCSGIEAASVAWAPLGWRAVAVSEIDPFPCHVLQHRQGAGRPLHMPSPDAPGLSLKEARAHANAIKAMANIPEAGRIPNFGDMTAFREWPDAAIDLLVGGTPCQSFSVAGLRKGMDDPRGNLALVYLAIAERYRPGWLVWENVPGVLSSSRGRDFGSFLGALAQLGYGFAWRVLDAQYIRTLGFPFAVPQRRRRVFLVGYLGNWRPAAAVLFDGQSLRGDPPPRREAGKVTAPTLAARTRGGGGLGTDFDLDGGLIAGAAPISMAHGQGGAEIGFNNGPTLTCNHEAPIVAHALRAEGFDASEDGTGRGTPIVPVAFDAQAGGNTGLAIGADVSGALHGGGKHGGRAAVAHPVAIQERAVSENPDAGPDGIGCRDDGAAYTLEARTTATKRLST